MPPWLSFFTWDGLYRIHSTVQWFFRVCVVLFFLQFKFRSLEGCRGQVSILKEGFQFVTGVLQNILISQCFRLRHMLVSKIYSKKTQSLCDMWMFWPNVKWFISSTPNPRFSNRSNNRVKSRDNAHLDWNTASSELLWMNLTGNSGHSPSPG